MASILRYLAVTFARASKCDNVDDREHVTPWMRKSPSLRTAIKKNSIDYSNMRWTVDEPEDLQVSYRGDHFGGRSDFSWHDVLS